MRKDHEQPLAVSKHGIPTTEKKPNEIYLPQYKFYVYGFDTSDYGIEWMRFEDDSPISDIIKKIPHIAFEVDDLNEAIIGKKLIGEITSPTKGTELQ